MVLKSSSTTTRVLAIVSGAPPFPCLGLYPTFRLLSTLPQTELKPEPSAALPVTFRSTLKPRSRSPVLSACFEDTRGQTFTAERGRYG